MPLSLPPLYAIVDADVAARHGWSAPELASACLRGGARLLQVRAKHASSAELLAIAGRVVVEARAFGAVVVVNDRADVAALSGADGVHVGQEDLSIEGIRRAFPSLRVIGVSTHTMAQVASAVSGPASYIAVGPVYATGTKDTGYEAVGLALVAAARRVVVDRDGRQARPLVAIGGIGLDTASAVIDAGASSVAVISDLLAGGDPEARVRAYLERLGPSNA